MGYLLDGRRKYIFMLRIVSRTDMEQNTIEDLYNFMLADDSTAFDVADSTTIGQLALQQSESAWAAAINGANDDALVRTVPYAQTGEQPILTSHVRSGLSSLCGRSATTVLPTAKTPRRTRTAPRSSIT